MSAALMDNSPDTDESVAIWAAVDHLTLPARRSVERDDGSHTWVKIASLWDLSTAALITSTEGSVRTGSASERSPIDLGLVQVRALIARTTRHFLYERQQVPNRPGTPAQLRQLAAYVVGRERDDHWWWSYRFNSWARLLHNHLALDARVPSTVRLRNSPCPRCRVRQVVIEAEDGLLVVPPLVVDFRDGYVRAASCTACGAMWWRGADLQALADSLVVHPGKA